MDYQVALEGYYTKTLSQLVTLARSRGLSSIEGLGLDQRGYYEQSGSHLDVQQAAMRARCKIEAIRDLAEALAKDDVDNRTRSDAAHSYDACVPHRQDEAQEWLPSSHAHAGGQFSDCPGPQSSGVEVSVDHMSKYNGDDSADQGGDPLQNYLNQPSSALLAEAEKRGIAGAIGMLKQLRKQEVWKKDAAKTAWEDRTLAELLVAHDVDPSLTCIDFSEIRGIGCDGSPTLMKRWPWDTVLQSIKTGSWRDERLTMEQTMARRRCLPANFTHQWMADRGLAGTVDTIRSLRGPDRGKHNKESTFWKKTTMAQILTVMKHFPTTQHTDLVNNPAIGSVQGYGLGEAWLSYVKQMDAELLLLECSPPSIQ